MSGLPPGVTYIKFIRGCFNLAKRPVTMLDKRHSILNYKIQFEAFDF